jgi:PAS domain S-box-containing protein
MESLKILVVDDDERVRGIIRSFVSSRPGWSVCGEAADGVESIEQAKAKHPDVVLMDVTMPRMNGLEATRVLRREMPEMDVILVSQNDARIVSRQAADVGAHGYCSKSDLRRDLVPMIERTTEKQETRRNQMNPAELQADAGEQTNNLLAAIVDSSDDIIISKNLEGIITSWNKSAEQVFGYTAQEAIGKPLTLIIPRDRQQEEIDILDRIRRGERIDHFDTVRQRKDGSLVDVSVTISPVKDSSGRVIGASKVAREITERKRWERNTALLAAIVDSSDDVIVSKNLDGIITSWNRGAERTFGYTASEAIGKHITLIIPQNRLEEENEILRRLRRGERVDHFETLRQRKDGVLLDMSLTISPVRDARGHIVGASKVARDITLQKRAEQILRESEAKFRAVFEQTTQFAGIVTKDGVLIEANRLCLEVCGYKAGDVLGKFFWETPWWRNFKESQEKIRAAIPLASQGTPFREILRYSRADGTERAMQFALYPIVDENGTVIFLHPTGVDITDQKRTEENYRRLAETLDAEVRARTRELEEKNADILRQSEQVRDLSLHLMKMQDHERRHIARELHDSAGQTLAVLGMSLGALVQKAETVAPELVQDGERIEELAQQLHREIRTTSYLLHPPLLDENGLTSALSWYVQGLSERSGLAIALDIRQDFGRLPADMELAIFRVVQEGLTNIHRHSNSKNAEIRIAREEDRVRIDIEDRGKGMSPERLAEIQSRGSGVGIRGMRERVRQFQGKMEMESSASGTHIVVRLPIPPEVSSAEIQSAPAALGRVG